MRVPTKEEVDQQSEIMITNAEIIKPILEKLGPPGDVMPSCVLLMALDGKQRGLPAHELMAMIKAVVDWGYAIG